VADCPVEAGDSVLGGVGWDPVDTADGEDADPVADVD
jgi:hypothetical protein